MGIADMIPAEMKGEKSRVVIWGRQEALVEKHRGLISYETEQILFRVKGGQVYIKGTNLVITSFGVYDAVVQGNITQVQLTEGEG
ncbi:MAG: YabP/YqfC family sporulation protein [Clostridia bacterium]|nr:YabP/YqfC family sporulation protein [Clostridia bacterium]